MLAKLGAAESSQNRVGGAEVLSTTFAPCPAMPPQANNPLSGQTQAGENRTSPGEMCAVKPPALLALQSSRKFSCGGCAAQVKAH